MSTGRRAALCSTDDGLPATLPFAPASRVTGERIRILSDLHYGDRASRVDQLDQLRPLLEGVTHLILNGDTLDTRPGPAPEYTAECRATVTRFFSQHVAATTYLSGNHDAEFSPVHHLDLAGRTVFVTHGDVFFDDLVPWSNDAPLISERIAAELRSVPPELHHHLDQRLAVMRRVAASIPQRHQSERSRLRHAMHLLADTIWPPLRMLRVVRAWQHAPRRAMELTQRCRPSAKFVISGHTHRPGIWPMPGGLTVINTGSFCRPFGAYVVDVTGQRLVVRRVDFRGKAFRVGLPVAEFPLAGD